MSVNSRSKGNRNERSAAELISKWTNRKFSRTPSSGGLNWKAAFSKGDIVCSIEAHYFPFCVEVKAHKEINFAELLMPGKKGVKILEFWTQCKRDADKCGKIPMLMMRYNGMPSDLFFIVLPVQFTKNLNMFARMSDLRTTLKFWDMDKDIQLIIMPSTEFFQMKYKDVKLTAKKFIADGKEK